MILSAYLTVAFGSLLASAALIPRVPSVSPEVCIECLLLCVLHLTLLLQRPVVVTSDLPIPVAPSAPEKTVRQDSQAAENSAMDAMYDDAMYANADFKATEKDRHPSQKYSEFILNEDLKGCVSRYGSDPAKISGQSSISGTIITNVRYFQCNQALIKCNNDALETQAQFLPGWPAHLNDPSPVMRTTTLERGMIKCNRLASNNQDPVWPDSNMNKETFELRGTVAMCNVPLIACLETVQDKWEDLRIKWDTAYPY